MGQRQGLSEQDLHTIERRCQTHRGRLERSRLVATWTHNARPVVVIGLTAIIVARIFGLAVIWVVPVVLVALGFALWRAWRGQTWAIPEWKLPAMIDHRSGARGSLMMALDGELDPAGVLGDATAVTLARPRWKQTASAWGTAVTTAILCVAVPIPGQHGTPAPVSDARAVIDAVALSGDDDAFVDSAKETLEQLARADTLEPEDFEALERIQKEARARLHARLDANELERAVLRELDAILERAPGKSREQTARELAAAKRELERLGSKRGAELASKAQSLASSLKSGKGRPGSKGKRGARAPSPKELRELRRRVQQRGRTLSAAMVATAATLEQHGGGTSMTRTILAQAPTGQRGQRGQRAGQQGAGRQGAGQQGAGQQGAGQQGAGQQGAGQQGAGQQGAGQQGAGQQGAGQQGAGQQGAGQQGAGQQGAGQQGAGQQGIMASNGNPRAGSSAWGAAGISRGPGTAPMVFRRRALPEGKIADIALPRGGDRATQIVSTTWGAMPEAGTRDGGGSSDAAFKRGSDSPYWDKRMLPRHRDVVRTYFRLRTEK